MASILDAINAAAAELQSGKKERQEAVQTTPTEDCSVKTQSPNSGGEAAAKKNKAQAKTDSPRTKGGAKYVIPKEFKQAIEDHLKGRADMAEKLKQKGKSIDGCCDYIFDVMRKRAEKDRKGSNAVGLCADPQEVFGMAVHYYDETEEALKEELKKK